MFMNLEKKRCRSMQILKWGVIGVVAFLGFLYAEILIYSPIILFGPFYGGGLLCLGMSLLSLLVAVYAGEGKPRWQHFVQKLENKSAKIKLCTARMGLVTTFLVSALLAGGLITTFIFKRYLGVTGFRLKALAVLSSILFAVAWTGIYINVWEGFFKQVPILVK
jgi:hypothetical protein